MSKWIHFTDIEVLGLDPELVSKLDSARHVAGIPFVITSGKRTLNSNTDSGGVEDSSHLSGLAVDLRASASGDRYLIVSALLRAGFKRIGVYNKHVHCDLDLAKPQNVMWIGESH